METKAGVGNALLEDGGTCSIVLDEHRAHSFNEDLDRFNNPSNGGGLRRGVPSVLLENVGWTR